jgi:aldehyde:ferredoxin oxidoreductase
MAEKIMEKFGTIVHIDLTTGKNWREGITEEMRRLYVGGRGISARLLYDLVPKGADPLGPENVVIFAAGALSGTAAPCAARFTVTGKSPLTGLLGDANAGGRFGPALRRAGVDHLAVHGRAEKPVYVFVDDGKIEIRDAGRLWGTTTRETEELITAELGDRRVRIASIGPAGENLVKIASITHEDRSASRTGLGAVMGSKNLKAVAVIGTGIVPLHDGQGFKEFAMAMQKRIKEAKVYDGFRKFAGIGGVAPTNKFHIMAIRNFNQAGDFEAAENFSAPAVAARFYEGSTPCFGCPIGCGHTYKVKDGPYAGEHGKKIEEGAFTPMGPVCGNSDIDSIFKMNNMANGLGIDMIELGQALAVVMDWYEHGVVTAADLDGIELTWGNASAMMAMMEKIARRDGVGSMLAEGIVRAAPHFGPEAVKYVSHSKGMVMAGIEPRMIKGSALGMATSTRGADHLRCVVPPEFVWFKPMTPEKALERFGTADILDPLSYNKAPGAVYFQNQSLELDLFEVCLFAVRGSEKDCPMGDLCRLFSLAFGIEMDEGRLTECAERVYTLERAFLCREGVTRKDDRLVGKWVDGPLPSGPYKGEIIDPQKWEAMLDDYYRLRGWSANGVPSTQRLSELGINGIEST